MSSYNGWRNWETWNVNTWINSEEPLYRAAVEYARATKRPTYRGLVEHLGLTGKTPDGVGWLSRKLSHRELTRMIRELGA
jgi:hypothetical protein